MSEPQTPPPPPQDPPSPPPASGSGGSAPSSNRNIMIVLSYLWLLALVPLLVEKDDKEVQWHAKHGLVILAAEIVVWIALTFLQFVPGLGTVLGCGLTPLVWLLFLVIRVIALVKGIQGQRLIIPGLSQYADRF